MNKIKRYGKKLEAKACVMRNILKDEKCNKNKEKHFKDYEEQNKLYKKSQFIINLGFAIEKTTL